VGRLALQDEMKSDAARRGADDQNDDSDGFDSDSHEWAASAALQTVRRALDFGSALLPPADAEDSVTVEQADNIIKVRNLRLRVLWSD